jgi:hypothetical protein
MPIMWNTSISNKSVIHCRAHTEERHYHKIQDNMHEALGPNENNLHKIITFLKSINMYHIIIFNNNFFLTCSNYNSVN